MALGALLIQRRLKCSNRRLVKRTGENPYLQFFIGMKEYGSCPFGTPMLVKFRIRFSEKDMATILEASIPRTEKDEDEDDGDDSAPYLYLRNLYETQRMAITLLTGGGSPTVCTSISKGVEPRSVWPWRKSELTKQLTPRPNATYSVEAWDVYKNGIYLYTEYDVYIK